MKSLGKVRYDIILKIRVKTIFLIGEMGPGFPRDSSNPIYDIYIYY